MIRKASFDDIELIEDTYKAYTQPNGTQKKPQNTVDTCSLKNSTPLNQELQNYRINNNQSGRIK